MRGISGGKYETVLMVLTTVSVSQAEAQMVGATKDNRPQISTINRVICGFLAAQLCF